LVGPTPFAFLVGVAIVTAGVFASASLAALRRPPVLPAALFVIFASLLVLMPANVGDKPNAYSFAMSYNRYGWSLLSILALILFVPPRNRVAGDWIDVANAGLLVVALFYLKVTYFAGGLACLAILISARPRPPAGLVGDRGLIVANAMAPWNHPYLLDILHAAAAGAVRNSLSFHLSNFFANAEGYAPYAAGLVVAVWMWAYGMVPMRTPLAIAGILAIGAFVLSQNHQTYGLPVGIVIAFLLYDQIRERFGPATPVLPMLMVFPLFAIGASAFSLAGYHANAGREGLLQVIERTQLKGLAVPAERPGSGRLRTASSDPRCSLVARRAAALRASPAEYGDDRRGDCLTGRRSPLPRRRRGPRPGESFPFMLGWPPPRGGTVVTWCACSRRASFRPGRPRPDPEVLDLRRLDGAGAARIQRVPGAKLPRARGDAELDRAEPRARDPGARRCQTGARDMDRASQIASPPL
jgi:hypothetical protein